MIVCRLNTNKFPYLHVYLEAKNYAGIRKQRSIIGARKNREIMLISGLNFVKFGRRNDLLQLPECEIDSMSRYH